MSKRQNENAKMKNAKQENTKRKPRSGKPEAGRPKEGSHEAEFRKLQGGKLAKRFCFVAIFLFLLLFSMLLLHKDYFV